MRFQEIDNTRLTLSLASSDDDDIHAHGLHHRQENKRSKPNSQMIWHSYLPSRFLGSLPMELQLGYGKDNNNRSSDVMMNSQASPTGPSLFRFRSKREKDEVKMERQEKPDSSRDEYIVLQDEEFGTRKKLKLTKDQSVVLEDSFKEHTTLNSKQKHDLARRLYLRPRQVEVWFQNRRARMKIKETEEGHELLRNCFEALSNENKRLEREVQELKTSARDQTTLPPPFYKMAMPVVTMCSFCERSYGGDSIAYNSTQSSPCMYSSSLHQSAVCETGKKSSNSNSSSSSDTPLSLTHN